MKIKTYTTEESKNFPRQFRTISIKKAMKLCKNLIPRQSKEVKKPNDK